MQNRHWCFTINHCEQRDDDGLIALGPTVRYLVYGYETGDSGPAHLQGYAIFPRDRRRPQSRRILSGRAHLSPKRGKPKQSATHRKTQGFYMQGKIKRLHRGRFTWLVTKHCVNRASIWNITQNEQKNQQ